MLFLILHLICLSLVFILTVWRLEREEKTCVKKHIGRGLVAPSPCQLARIFIYICMCSSFSLGLGNRHARHRGSDVRETNAEAGRQRKSPKVSTFII
jgi:hypothetical protein